MLSALSLAYSHFEGERARLFAGVSTHSISVGIYGFSRRWLDDARRWTHERLANPSWRCSVLTDAIVHIYKKSEAE